MTNFGSENDDSVSLFKAGTTGAVAGALFYFVIARGVLYTFLGPRAGDDGMITAGFWIGRVMSSWINLFTLMAFGMAMAMLWARKKQIEREESAFSIQILGSDPETLLLPEDALTARKQLKQMTGAEQNLLLVQLIHAGLQRARAHWSSIDVSEAVKNYATLIGEKIDAQYAMIRYLAWAIPSIGFVGTVLGIGEAMGALNVVSDGETHVDPMQIAASNLNSAFDTTFVALVLSLVLMNFLYRIQAQDDSLLARASQWCMQRLVFRMHIRQEDR